MSEKIKILWEGSIFINHSLAIVNREICSKLLNFSEIDLSVTPYEKHHFSEIEKPEYKAVSNLFYKNLPETDFVIRLKWPPDFSNPENGKLIIFQLWEMTSMPKSWLEPFLKIADEIWVSCNSNKDVYISEGIPEEKVFVLPLGLKKELYEKDFEQLELNDENNFRFLFIGGTIFRKGVDILLNAYIQEFTKDEKVSLVIKDIGLKNIYNDTYQKGIQDIISNKNTARIIYLNDDFDDNKLMRLYQSCQCYVHPYRGEGFALPVLEAMGKGLPVIVTGTGSATDFCKPEHSYYLDYEIIQTEDKNFGNLETINPVFYPEVSIKHLRKIMRHVFENRNEAKEKGKIAEEYALNNYSWEITAEKLFNHLKEIKHKPLFRENHEYYFNKYQEKGKEYLYSEDYQNALKYFGYAENLISSTPENNFYLGIIEYKTGNLSKSLELLTKAYKYGYKDKEIFKYLSLSLEALGDIETSEIMMKKYSN